MVDEAGGDVGGTGGAGRRNRGPGTVELDKKKLELEAAAAAKKLELDAAAAVRKLELDAAAAAKKLEIEGEREDRNSYLAVIKAQGRALAFITLVSLALAGGAFGLKLLIDARNAKVESAPSTTIISTTVEAPALAPEEAAPEE